MRQPIPIAVSTPQSRPETAASPVETAVGAAYRVYDQYVEEGRRYAAGQSAWFNRQNRPSVATRALESVATTIPRETLAPWVDLAAKVIPAIAAELARRGGASAPVPSNATPPQEAWRPWFGQSTTTQRENTIPASELQRRQPAAGPSKR